MGLVESAQMAQDWYLHKEEMQFNQQAMMIDKKGLSIDLVNTVREDLRDLFQSRATRIDNLMLVNTLLLSFSFGFVCEGTFPPGDSEEGMLVVYVILCGMTLVAPFWSIWFGLECKQKLDHFLNEMLSQRTDDRLKLETWLGFYKAFEKYWKLQCQLYYKIALNLFWIGMLLALALCCVLLFLVFEDLFPETSVRLVFVSIVGFNIVIAIGFILKRVVYWCFHLGAKSDNLLKSMIAQQFVEEVETLPNLDKLKSVSARDSIPWGSQVSNRGGVNGDEGG